MTAEGWEEIAPRIESWIEGSLGRLRRNGLIEAEKDGNAWRCRWGKRALNIAREAGVDVRAA